MAGSGPIKNFSKSQEMSRKFHDLVPGASHTYSKGEDQFPLMSPHIISHADGAYCWDIDGNKFMDWAMGNRVFILGHNNKVVNDAVKQQIDKGINFTRPGILEYELAEYLIDLLPVAEMVKFGKNGSDVTTAAIKLGRAYTNREYVAVCKQHPFFSIHDWFIGTTPCDNGIPQSEKNYSLSFDYNSIESVKELFAKYPSKIACLILEPVKNDEPKNNFLKELKDTCQKEGTVLIFDEMISGIRFDIRGAHHLYGVYPDLATFGKCISNGFSFSVLAGRRDIMELGGIKHNKKRTFLLSQTHGSETVGLIACKATLDECRRLDINQHIWRIGKKLKDEFNKLAKQNNVDEYVRIIGFDCNPQILCTQKNGLYCPELTTSFHEELISYGILIPWISITFSHTDHELEITMEALQMGMKKVSKILESGKVKESFIGEAVKPVFRPYN